MMNVFEGVPRLRRRFRAHVAAWVVIMAGTVIAVKKDDHLFAIVVVTVVAVIGFEWCLVVWLRSRKQAREVMVKMMGLACLGCGYSLVGADEGGNCPECGRSFYAEHTRRCWSQAAGFEGEQD